MVHLACQKFPLIAQRDLLIEGYGDIHEGESVILYIRSVGDGEYASETAELNAKARKQKAVRAECVSGMLFTPRDDRTTQITMTMNMDLKMAFIPGWLLDFFLKHFAKDLLPMMAKEARKYEPGGELAHMMETKPAAFAEMDRRLSTLPTAPKTSVEAV